MNMSYCRFQNTLNDLLDCQSSLTNNDNEDPIESYKNLSLDEQRAFKYLIETCKEIVEETEELMESL